MRTRKNTTILGAILALAMILTAALFTGCPDALSTEAAISSFSFSAESNDALLEDVTATIDGTAIAATVPFGTDITALAATAAASVGAVISPDPAVAADYTSPVAFTVTAEDAETTAVYTVTVTVAAEDPDPADPDPSDDTTAPAPGSVSVRSVGLEAVMMEWTAASDEVTAAGDLEYRLYYSTEDNISTAADAETNGTAVGSGYATGITSATATGLAQTTAYYFTVVVQDEAGNKAAYTSLQQGTRVSVIENDVSDDSDYLKAVAAEGPYVYLAGSELGGSVQNWRIEKRRLDTGELVADFGTDGVIEDGLAGNDEPVSMLIIGDYLFVSGYDSSESNQQWRTQVYNKTTGASYMGKKNNPSGLSDRIMDIAADEDYLYLAGSVSSSDQIRIEKRSLTDLNPDTAFNSSGYYQEDIVTSYGDFYQAVAVDSTHVFAAGTMNNDGGSTASAIIDKFDKGTGVLDTAFGTAGRLTLPAGRVVAGMRIRDGFLYAAVLSGFYDEMNSSMYLYKISTADGSFSTAFGGGSDYRPVDPGGNHNPLFGNPLTLDDDSMYLVSCRGYGSMGDPDWYIEKRSLTHGELDSFFGTGGVVYENLATTEADEYPETVFTDDLNVFAGGVMHNGSSYEWYLRILDKVTGE